MHEMSIAAAIFEVVQRYVPRYRGPLVRCVHVRLGENTPVLPESLAFCFNAIVADTPYDGATLAIQRVADNELTVREVDLLDLTDASEAA